MSEYHDEYESALKWAQENLSIEEIARICKKIAAKDTSGDPDGWSAERPLWAHCPRVSLIVEKLRGGSIVRQSLHRIEGFEKFNFHYSNRLPDGSYCDLSIGELRDILPENTPKEECSRNQMLSKPEARTIYELFEARFIAEVIKRMPSS